MVDVVVKRDVVGSELFADLEAVILDGHRALNQWGAFWRQNLQVVNLGYPTINPVTRLVTPSRSSLWDDVDVMPLEVEHVDQLIRSQSLLVLEAARCYYISNQGLSMRAAADSLGHKVDGFVSLARINELLRIAKYVVGMGRVADGFV